jgi:hypothetical protein
VFWPLLLAPVVFVLAYHFLNPFPFDVRPYRIRLAYFFVPVLALVSAAVGTIITESRSVTRTIRVAVAALLAAVFLTALPKTAWILTENDAIDFGQAGDVLRAELPADAIVLYDSPAPPGGWRQAFSGPGRYLDGAPELVEATNIAKKRSGVRGSGPVYLLILDSECASSVVCDMPELQWDRQVPGFEVVEKFDRFTLYAPTEGQEGRAGMKNALTALTDAYGPRYGTVDTYAAAQLMRDDAEWRMARELVAELYKHFDETEKARYYEVAKRQGIYPLPRPPG